MRRVKVYARRTGLAWEWVAERSIGSHGTVYLGDRFTVIKDLKKEIGPSLLSAMCKQLGVRKEDLWMFVAMYPASIRPEDNVRGFYVRYPDLPEALTGGDDLNDALAQASDCLAEALAGRIRWGDPIPAPSRVKRRQHSIGVPLYLAPKLAFYIAMREEGLRNTDIAERLGVSETVVRRMLDPRTIRNLTRSSPR